MVNPLSELFMHPEGKASSAGCYPACKKKENFNRRYEEKIFYKMFSPSALNIADPYLVEEKKEIKEHILEKFNNKIKNIIVIGAGPLRYLDDFCDSNQNYVAVDKFLNTFTDDNSFCLTDKKYSTLLINNCFENLKKGELPEKDSLYIFTFNVISYISNPLFSLSTHLNKNNVVYISGWNNSFSKERTDYLNHLYDSSSPYLQGSSSFVDVHDLDYNVINLKHKIKKHEGVFIKSVIIDTYEK